MAQVDYFLKLSGIDGESTDDKHKGEIEVLSFSWGVSQTGNKGSGGGAGKVNFNDFSIIKTVDTSTPALMVACCSGQHIPEATFTARKAGKEQQEFLVIKLTDLLVSSVAPGGSAGEAALPMEQISFSFGGSMITAVRQNPDGTFEKAVSQTLCGGSQSFDGPVLEQKQRR